MGPQQCHGVATLDSFVCDVLCCIGEGSSSQYRLFAPKCICIITHWPFYRGLRTFLQQVSAHSNLIHRFAYAMLHNIHTVCGLSHMGSVSGD